MYTYQIRVIRVVDGDTLHADVDLGCDIHVALTLRLARTNAPELTTEAGPRSRQWLEDALDGRDVVLKTVKDRREKYGRYLAELFVGDININDAMVATGYAGYATY